MKELKVLIFKKSFFLWVSPETLGRIRRKLEK